ncbi:MAG TPA: hypothetical protein VF593_02710, partial [Chthoniobacteraceae bacterium]
MFFRCRRLSLVCAATFAALLVPGCGDRRARAEETLGEVGASQLRSDAALLYKGAFATPGADFVLVKSSQWPASFHRFQPIRVGAFRDGISLTLLTSSGTEAGLYIVPQSMDQPPSKSRGGTFEPIGEGVYW